MPVKRILASGLALACACSTGAAVDGGATATPLGASSSSGGFGTGSSSSGAAGSTSGRGSTGSARSGTATGGGTSGGTVGSTSSSGPGSTGAASGGTVGSSSSGSVSSGATGGGTTGGGSTGSSGMNPGWCFPGGVAPPCPGGAPCTLDGGGSGICCEGSCADLNGDPLNCGWCGERCSNGAACTNGVCYYPSCTRAPPGFLLYCTAGGACPSQFARNYDAYGCLLGDGGAGVCCGGGCRDSRAFWADPNNCGDCGFACPKGAVCAAGACVFPDGGYPSSCGNGMVRQFDLACVPANCSVDGGPCLLDGGLGVCCNGSCTDIFSDPVNCGGCGLVCTAGQACIETACVAPADCSSDAQTPYWSVSYPSYVFHGAICSLDGGFGLCCNGGCADFSSDPMNCGGCGIACAVGVSCFQSSCSGACLDGGCPTGWTCQSGGCSADCSVAGSDGRTCTFIDAQGVGEAGQCCGGQCTGPSQACGGCGLDYACACLLNCDLGLCQ